MTVREATGRYFQGFSEGHVRDLARQGNFGDLIRLGKKWLISETGIVKFLNGRRVSFDPVVGRIPDPHATPKRLSNLVQFRDR